MKFLMLSILMILLSTACSHQVQPVATKTVVEKDKLPKSVTEPWFNSNIESNDKTAGGALDLILRLRGELQKADSQLKYIRENYQSSIMRTKRPVFVYQIQAEGTLDQVVQARVEGKADVQDLLMEYCKMKKPL